MLRDEEPVRVWLVTLAVFAGFGIIAALMSVIYATAHLVRILS